MRNLIKFNGYAAPDPTEYEVTLKQIDGASEELENGDTYIERIVAQKPSIKIGWTNLLVEDVSDILSEVKQTAVNVDYWFAGWKSAELTAGDIDLTLKTDADAERWDLSFELE